MRTGFALFSRISSAYLFVLTGYRLGCSHTISSELVICRAMYYQYWYYHGSTVAQYKLYSSTGTQYWMVYMYCTGTTRLLVLYCLLYGLHHISFSPRHHGSFSLYLFGEIAQNRCSQVLACNHEHSALVRGVMHHHTRYCAQNTCTQHASLSGHSTGTLDSDIIILS